MPALIDSLFSSGSSVMTLLGVFLLETGIGFAICFASAIGFRRNLFADTNYREKETNIILIGHVAGNKQRGGNPSPHLPPHLPRRMK